MKNIVVMGACEVEVQGVLSLLEGEGIPAVRAGVSPLKQGDLLIVAMSAKPLLGWARHLFSLLTMKLRWGCTMIVLTPNEIADVRLLDAVGCIVPSGYSLGWMSNALLCLVAKWRQGKPLPVGNVRRISAATALDIDEVAYFFAQTMPTSGLARLSKTEYGRRNRALLRMGFCHLQQFKLFMAGVVPQVILSAQILLLQEHTSRYTKASKNITSFVYYDKGDVGYPPMPVVSELMLS